jgi:hypothetical protein
MQRIAYENLTSYFIRGMLFLSKKKKRNAIINQKKKKEECYLLRSNITNKSEEFQQTITPSVPISNHIYYYFPKHTLN